MIRKTLTTFFSIVAITFSITARQSATITEIAPYVYPQNRPAAPQTMKFMPGGESYLIAIDENTIVQFDTKSGSEIATIFTTTKTRETSITDFDDFVISPDGSKLLIMRDSEAIYRRSFKAEWYVFDIKRNILKPLSRNHQKQQVPVFSPDNRMVAFVADNNIYIKKLDYDNEVAITTDGVANSIINGATDWTYEEEFVATSTLAWAPDSQTLCYVKFDESHVPMYSLTMYGGTCNAQPQYSLYPGQIEYKYPVAGQTNSYVTLHSYDVATRRTKNLSLPDPNIEYIPRIDYATADVLVVTTLNRDQNRMELYAVNPKSTVAKSLLVEESNAWITPITYENLIVSDKSLIINSARSGWNHLYEYSLSGAMLRQITSGNYDVTACYGADAAGSVYFSSTKSGPLNRVVSKIDIKGKEVELSNPDVTASASFTDTKNYYILNTSSASQPPLYELKSSNGKILRTLVDNSSLLTKYIQLPTKEFITVTSEGVELNGYIIKPTNFDASRRYPVIMWQYSGPDSQEVRNAWSVDWQQYAASKGFVVICVDGRGTGFRGREFANCVYRNLGYYETLDQLAVARYAASLPYVDASRIGIAGWSYGGYETLMAVTAENAPYKAAVAIAPVTDWRLYDTVYTERYMLTPQANEDGYNSSSPLLRADKLNCELLIMHGTADDNVHPANTMEFISRLEAAGSYCDMLLFPNMNHSINGCNARAVVYGRMIDWFSRNL